MNNTDRDEQMKEAHSVRIRGHRWDQVERHAWKLMQQTGTFIKPSDIVDACIWLHVDKITVKDLENAKKTQVPDQ